MKRTKERFGKFENYNIDGQSGLKVFDGEDLEYQDRYRLQQLQQKNWVEQQKSEKENRYKEERDEEREYADQTLSINRMRGILEANHEQKRKEMNRQMMEMNKKLAEEKRNRDIQSKYYETQLDMYNINEAEEKRKQVYGKLKEEIDSCKGYYTNNTSFNNNLTSNSAYGSFAKTKDNINSINHEEDISYNNNVANNETDQNNKLNNNIEYNNNINSDCNYDSQNDWKNQNNYECN